MHMMSRRAQFIPYSPKTILNKAKRADSLFWTRYSAYPYIGCQHGCEFCYCREEKFYPYEDVNDFAYLIKVKQTAPALLRRALQRLPVDVIFTGDYQPAEQKFRISRQMLQVCLELGFPVFVLERSPRVLDDLDLLKDLDQRARAAAAFSIISAPGSPAYERVCALERFAPPAARRFAAMERLAAAGLLTGTVCMPVLPTLCDTPENLEAVVRATADHGGQFVLFGGLTLADQQREWFLRVLAERMPDLLAPYQRFYPPGSYGPPGEWHLRTARLVRELCLRYGITDVMPRPVIPGEKRALNKLVVEALAKKVHALELDQAPQSRIWAYRKAAWAIEDLEQELGLFYRMLGRKGLERIPDVGPGMAGEIAALIGIQDARGIEASSRIPTR
jgi:DNA repair photolyase